MKSEFKITPEFAPQKVVWLQWPTPRIGEEGIDEHDFIPAFVEIEQIRLCTCAKESDAFFAVQARGAIESEN